MKKASVLILLLSISLLAIGLIVVMSASSNFSQEKFDSTYHLFGLQLGKVGIGVFFLLLFAAIDYRIWMKKIKLVLMAVILLLIFTLCFAHSYKGAGRWISLGFLSFQPSDIAKYVLILYLAAYIDKKKDDLKDFKKGLAPALVMILAVASLIFLQPNVSNGSLIIVVSFTMLFIAGANVKHLIYTVLCCLTSGAIAALIMPHSRARLLSYFTSVNTGKDINIQVKQAILGLGSGGVFGLGIGGSRQNKLFLPESYGDFIFAILGEEFGFLGTVFTCILFLALFVLGLVIAKKAADKFGQMTAFGISFTILLYSFVNIGVTSGLFPTTGLPLPFISYGGTSIIFLCIAVGILINIGFTNSKNMKKFQNINLASEQI